MSYWQNFVFTNGIFFLQYAREIRPNHLQNRKKFNTGTVKYVYLCKRCLLYHFISGGYI